MTTFLTIYAIVALNTLVFSFIEDSSILSIKDNVVGSVIVGALWPIFWIDRFNK